MAELFTLDGVWIGADGRSLNHLTFRRMEGEWRIASLRFDLLFLRRSEHRPGEAHPADRSVEAAAQD